MLEKGDELLNTDLVCYISRTGNASFNLNYYSSNEENSKKKKIVTFQIQCNDDDEKYQRSRTRI